MNTRTFLVSTAFLLSALGVASSALGQTRIQISPQIIEATVSPGGTFSEVLTFTNAGSVTAMVELEPADFDVDESGNPRIYPLGAGPGGHSLAPYLRVTPVSVRVEPGQSVRYRLTAKLPQEFGQLREMLYFVARPIKLEPAPGQTVIIPKIGVPVYLHSTRSKPATLEISDDRIVRKDADTLGLEIFTRNVGDRNIRPPVLVEVTEVGGAFYEVFEPNAGISPVLPGHGRLWNFDLGPVPAGELAVKLTFPTSLRESFVREYRVPAAEQREATQDSGS